MGLSWIFKVSVPFLIFALSVDTVLKRDLVGYTLTELVIGKLSVLIMWKFMTCTNVAALSNSRQKKLDRSLTDFSHRLVMNSFPVAFLQYSSYSLYLLIVVFIIAYVEGAFWI